METDVRHTKACVSLAMRDPEKWCIQMRYEDRKGKVTHRTVSPTRFVDESGDQFQALCLGREEPRQFVTERCSDVELVHSEDVLMPMPITEDVDVGGD